MSWIEEGVELRQILLEFDVIFGDQLTSWLENSQGSPSACRNIYRPDKKITLISVENRKLDLSKPVSNIIIKELNFWENEKSHNTTKHTCCVFDK